MRAIILLCLLGLIVAAPQQRMGTEGVRAPRAADAADDLPNGALILLGNSGGFGPGPEKKNNPTQDEVPHGGTFLLVNNGGFGPGPENNKPTQSSKTA